MDLANVSNLSDLLFLRTKETPDALAYRQFHNNVWREWTWGEVAREVGRWQKALTCEGLHPGDRVAICLKNCVEWVLFDQAALGLGLVTVPLYFDDRPDNMAACLNDAGARLLLLHDYDQWTSLRGRVPEISRVICLNDNAQDEAQARNFSAWIGHDYGDPIQSSISSNTLATILYTSGTTGRSKGVMLSHRNLLSNTIAAFRAFPVGLTDRFLSFLPLSHVFERTCGYYFAILAGAETVYARSIPLLSEDLKNQQPTAILVVPRIYERMWSHIQTTLPSGTLKRYLFDKTVDVGWRRFCNKSTFSDALAWAALKPLVADKINERFGGRLRFIMGGGAAFPPYLARIFIGLGQPILPGYGLTEASPVISANRLEDNEPFSAGRPLDGVEIRCGEGGELLARGPNIMLGYWNNPETTASAIDNEGWLHTGDLGEIRDGRVYITGRLKDIIVLSNGEKVSPVDAEQAILRDSVFQQIMLVGEGRPKLGLLCVSDKHDVDDLCNRANAQLSQFPGYIRISYVTRIHTPWTIENGLLTPTLKIKRKAVESRFGSMIETMYATATSVG